MHRVDARMLAVTQKVLRALFQSSKVTWMYKSPGMTNLREESISFFLVLRQCKQIEHNAVTTDRDIDY